MRIRTALVPLALTAALLGGCTQSPTVEPTPSPSPSGLATLTGDEILAKVQEQLKDTESFSMTGTAATETLGDPLFTTNFGAETDIEFKISGDDLSISLISAPSELEIVVVGTDLFVKISDNLLTAFGLADPSVASLLTGKWLKAPATNPAFADLTSLSDLPSTFLDGVTSVEKGEESTINGKKVIALTGSDSGILYVATEGDPVPVRLTAEEEGITLDFDFDEPEITAPTTDIFDLTPFL